MMTARAVHPRSSGPSSARFRAATHCAIALIGASFILLSARDGVADDRCSVSPVFNLPAELSTPDGLRAREGAHVIGRWQVKEGVLEVWLIATGGKISESFLTLSRRQLKRTKGTPPKSVANCIKVMAAFGPDRPRAGPPSWLIRSAQAAAADGSYRIVRSCAAPAKKGSKRLCHYALDRQESTVWKHLGVFSTTVSGR
jgi:hypothetical protein